MRTEREQLLLPLAQHPDIRRDSGPVSDDRDGAATLMLVARSRVGHGRTPSEFVALLKTTTLCYKGIRD